MRREMQPGSGDRYRLTVEEFFEEEAGETAGVVADDAMFLEEVVQDDAEAELLECGKIDGHRFSALRAIAPSHLGRHSLAIGDHPIDDPARDVLLDRAKVIGESVTGSLPGLGHQIGDVDAQSIRFGDGTGDFRDQQIRENAGVERARTEKNQVGLLDGFDGPTERTHAARRKLEFFDGIAASGDARFAVDGVAVFECGNQVHVRKRRGKNAATNREHFAADTDSFGEIAGDVSECGEEKIAEVVADEAATGVKTILEKAGEKGFVFRKRHHAIANVSRRKDAVFATQAAGAAAVIGDRDDGGKIGDGAFSAGEFVGAANDQFLEAAEERGQAGAASESDDAEAAGKSLWLGGTFFHIGFQDFRREFALEKGILHRERREEKTGRVKACPDTNR